MALVLHSSNLIENGKGGEGRKQRLHGWDIYITWDRAGTYHHRRRHHLPPRQHRLSCGCSSTTSRRDRALSSSPGEYLHKIEIESSVSKLTLEDKESKYTVKRGCKTLTMSHMIWTITDETLCSQDMHDNMMVCKQQVSPTFGWSNDWYCQVMYVELWSGTCLRLMQSLS